MNAFHRFSQFCIKVHANGACKVFESHACNNKQGWALIAMKPSYAKKEGFLRFITGANDKYCFMCGMLLESLQRCFPSVHCLVMDFGLSYARRKYFEEKKLLFNISAGLNKTDHPFKLKSNMASFLNDELSQMPIWIDCDIIAIRAGSEQLFDLANDMVSQNKDFAISTDEAPNKL